MKKINYLNMKIYIISFLIYFSIVYNQNYQTIYLDKDYALNHPNVIIKLDDIDKKDIIILEIGKACAQTYNVEYNIVDDDELKRGYDIFSSNDFQLLEKKEENTKNGICIQTYEIDIYADEDMLLIRLINLPSVLGLTIKAYKKSYLWIIILVIIGVVILLAGIAVAVYFIFIRKSNKSIINEPLSPEEEPVFKPSEENSNW